MRTELPWSNCRLQLASDVDEDADLPQGIVGRLYHTAASHPAVRQNLQTLTTRKVSLPALAVQQVVNLRGPDALVGAIPGEKVNAARLTELCTQLYESGESLVCELPVADVVLIPRVPSAASEDGLFFVVYATNLRAVELCEELRREAKVAVVLDVDNTLIDASAVTLSERDWRLVDWVPCEVWTQSGRRVAAQWARLEGHHDPLAEEVFLMHWRMHGLDCTYHVRVRKGWSILRAFLARNADRFTTFICSKGKQEYLELLWTFLDPEGILMPRELWPTRMTSTYPDAIPSAAPKTALSALGCASVLQPHIATQLAAPVIALDDSRSAYLEDYAASIMYVEEYKPSEIHRADSGSVLWQATRCLDAFWHATCTDQGAFAWQAAQSFAAALLGTVRRTRMESPDAIAYLQQRCRRQGEALWHQFTAHSVFAGQNYIQDEPELLAQAIARAAEAHELQEEGGKLMIGVNDDDGMPVDETEEVLERVMSACTLPPINVPCYTAAGLSPPMGTSDEEDGSSRARYFADSPAFVGLVGRRAQAGEQADQQLKNDSISPLHSGLIRAAGEDLGSATCLFATSDGEEDSSPLAISSRASPAVALGSAGSGIDEGMEARFHELSAA